TEPGRGFYGDQCALNVTLLGLWKDLGERWNFQRAQRNHVRLQDWQGRVNIVHYLGNRKPWNPVFSRTPASRQYFAYASRVGITGWRPSFADYLFALWRRNRPLIGYRLQQIRKAAFPDGRRPKAFRG
ncbi:MAG: glycosyltransferase, partial [Verrucomicrobiia bacterium]